MNICMLTSFFFPNIGGVEAHIYNISKSIQKKGHKVVIVHTLVESHPEGKEVIIENYDQIEVHRLFLLQGGKKVFDFHNFTGDNKLSFLFGFYKKARPNLYSSKIIGYIKKLHEREKFDILHQHDFSSNIRATKILSKYIPTVITNHTGEFLMINNRFWLRPLLKIFLNHYDHLIGPSRELCDVDFLSRKNKVSYIPNGVSIDKFRVISDDLMKELREKMGFKQSDILILCVRRWAPTKGVKYFVESIPIVLKKLEGKEINIKFLISGNDYMGYPNYKEEIMDIIRKNKLEHHICLLGNIPHNEMSNYIQVSDIVVLPSLMEATSLSGLEAMSCGKPLIGTNVGGIPELIDNGINGILIEPQSPEQIAEAIINLVNEPELRKSLGENARKKVELEFSWDIIANRTLEVYSKVISEKFNS